MSCTAIVRKIRYRRCKPAYPNLHDSMERTIIHRGQWLSYGIANWQTPGGGLSQWEFATRERCEGAVCVLAYTVDADFRPQKLIVVRQYRPPLDAPVLELPAGLIDPGSTPEETALKELREETGYLGEIISIGPAIFSSPGMTDESVHCAVIRVTGREEQDLQDHEAIEPLELPVEGLRATLQKLETAGTRMDAKLWSLAEGLELAALLG